MSELTPENMSTMQDSLDIVRFGLKAARTFIALTSHDGPNAGCPKFYEIAGPCTCGKDAMLAEIDKILESEMSDGAFCPYCGKPIQEEQSA